MEMNDELHVQWSLIRDKLSARSRTFFKNAFGGEFRPMPDILDLKVLHDIERFRNIGRTSITEIRLVLAEFGKRLPDFEIFSQTPYSSESLEKLLQREADLKAELPKIRARIKELRREGIRASKKQIIPQEVETTAK